MKEFERRPDLAALWKHISTPVDEPEVQKSPAVSINAVHGPVLSIVTNQPVQIAELWAQACAQGKRP